MKKRKTVDLTTGTVWKQILTFSFPLMITKMLQELYGLADSLIVGRYVGHTALAAVGGVTFSLTSLVIGFFMGMGIGAGVIVSRNKGLNDPVKIKRSIHTSMAVAIAFGLVIGLLGFILCPYVLRYMNTPDDVLREATIYLRIIFGLVITQTVYNMGAGIIRALGDTVRPLKYLVISGVLNIGLNILFVVKLGMGVEGVAIATVISQLLASILVVYRLMNLGESYDLNLKEIKFYKKEFIEILKIGIPTALHSTVIALSNIVVQTKLNAFGSTYIAAHSIGNKMDMTTYMPLEALSMSLTTFVAQNHGAGKKDRIKVALKFCIKAGFVIMCTLGWSSALLARYVVMLFSKEAAVMEVGVFALRIMCGTSFVFVFADILGAYERGLGNAVVPMLFTLANMCVFRIVWLLIMLGIKNSYVMIVTTYPVTWVLTSLCHVVYYKVHREKEIKATTI